MKSLESNSHRTEISWYYEEGDEDMRDIGKDFSGFTDLHFNIVECEEII